MGWWETGPFVKCQTMPPRSSLLWLTVLLPLTIVFEKERCAVTAYLNNRGGFTNGTKLTALISNRRPSKTKFKLDIVLDSEIILRKFRLISLGCKSNFRWGLVTVRSGNCSNNDMCTLFLLLIVEGPRAVEGWQRLRGFLFLKIFISSLNRLNKAILVRRVTRSSCVFQLP